MTYEEGLAQLEKKRAEAAESRRMQHEKEFEEHVLPLLMGDINLVHVPCPNAPIGVPSHYVGTKPSKAQAVKFKETLWGDSAQRGVVAAKARAAADLAMQCRVYPEAGEYTRLVEAAPMVTDTFGTALVNAAKAGADVEGKG